MNNEGNQPPLIRIGRVESVDLYEIKDTELELLEKGSPADLQLNFAIFLVSTAFSAIVALCTATFANSTVHTTFIVVAVVGILLASYLFISWSRSRTSVKAACLTIRRRIKETISRDVINRENLEVVASVDRSEAPSEIEPKR